MKTTTNLLSILSILLPSISAQIVNGNYVGFGTNSSAPDDGYATFKAADRMPNETHEVMFNRDNTITSGKNWTWTLKISNVAMPNDTGFDIGAQRSVDYPNAHVAFTTYDFGWPQGGNLNQAVAKGENLNSAITNTYPSCMYLIWAMWPANVSEKYDSSSSDCTSALGQDCVNKLLGGMQGGAECESNNFPSYLANEDSCQDSFGAIEGGGWAVLGVPFGNASAPANQTSIQSGGTYAWTLSFPYSGGNETAFESEKERLHVIGLSSNGQNQLLCNRVTESAATPSIRLGAFAAVSAIAVVAAFMNAM